MTDILTPRKRSEVMSRIRSRDTLPERILRRTLRARGVRYRSGTGLPGSPDVVLPVPKMAVLVHGDFWHGCPRHYVPPKTRAAFWAKKLVANRERDRRVTRQLRSRGWRVVVLWECDLESDADRAVDRLLELRRPKEGKRRLRHSP